jgi:hypothetical protein
MAIRYAVDLTDTERAALREIISKNKAKRSTIINAYILLKADRSCGWTNADIAAAYEVSTKKVEQLKKRFVEEGVNWRIRWPRFWRAACHPVCTAPWA